jgi:hypothetical protein
MTKVELYEVLQKGLEDGRIELDEEKAPLIRYRQTDDPARDLCPLTACVWLTKGKYVWMQDWPIAAQELDMDMFIARSIVYIADNVFP